jgi:5-methyltetrahydrofolate--homocysteine methyltransferase
VETARRHNASIIGLSALMTTTMVRMEDTLHLLKERGLPIKVMVGGAVLTLAYAKSIGADGYAADAVEAVRLANSLV